MKDRRFLKTEHVIRKVFLDLLKEKNLNQITVSEISRTANLGRGTFYLHYKDVYDLYSCIEDELYSELEKLFDKASPCNNITNLMTLTDNIMDYISMNSETFQIFFSHEDNVKTLSKLKKIFNDKILQETEKFFGDKYNTTEYDIIEANFIVSGVVGVLKEWLINGMKIPKENVSVILQKILTKF
ncbi:TetR/AcrR family transcriptional regulator [Clostridium sp. SHJSY1]|uniref:TetR/AcrR family transcriptional regulator n=1 Tax=Clostridium sp. SHJSY1 TaxID=2942483 RepID=UPI0028758DEC|nr:TetR-like C-terminal domain-containing protein [Clostridium sp. SHJSY1]MDS0525277.1 TetR/AcrR family transcriptional regulator [Clostridium sp. SHJSY1]